VLVLSKFEAAKKAQVTPRALLSPEPKPELSTALIIATGSSRHPSVDVVVEVVDVVVVDVVTGERVGRAVGLRVGRLVGLAVGARVVGASVGLAVGTVDRSHVPQSKRHTERPTLDAHSDVSVHVTGSGTPLHPVSVSVVVKVAVVVVDVVVHGISHVAGHSICHVSSAHS
jgi:hypothetical protein